MAPVEFLVPRVVAGAVRPAREAFPAADGLEGDVLVVWLFHDNGDGTTPEVLFWSRERAAWSADSRGGRGVPAGTWGPLRAALWGRGTCGRMFMEDDAVEAMEAFFAPDLWSWFLAASVMGS